ncbi:LysR family transcriptional regulator, partial [Burkholderia cepacia]
FMVLPNLLDGSLVAVLPDCNPQPKPISIVNPHYRHLSQKVRLFADRVSQVLVPPPSLEGGENCRGRVGAQAAKLQRGAVAW